MLINVKNAPYNAKGDGRTNDTAAIQSALNAATANQVVYLPASTYLISNTLYMNNANVSIRGDGPAATIIEYNGAAGGVDIITANPYNAWSSRVPVASTFIQGSKTITLTSARGIKTGDIVVMSQLNPSYANNQGDAGEPITWAGAPGPNGSGNDVTRCMTQVDRVTAINANVLTLERPLYLTFAAANSPAINFMTPTYGIGIEDLQLYNNSKGVKGGYNIEMGTLAESWVENVASVNATGAECDYHILLENAYACEVRECYFKGGGVNASGEDYGVYLINNCSDILVEDNIFVGMRHSLVIAAGGSGSVFGYNYSTGNIESDSGKGWCAEDAITHGAEPYMTLFEGNIVGQITFDDYHGGNSYNTAYRCNPLAFSTATGSGAANREAVDLQNSTYSANIVGCVLGRPADSSNTDIKYASGVQATSFIQGNYSCKLGKSTWISGAVALPASLYYKSKPSWWGTLPFPAIGPDLTPKNGQIPAAVRYAHGTL